MKMSPITPTLSAVLMADSGFVSDPGKKQILKVTVMSFNIRNSGAHDGENSWSNRKKQVCDIISHHSPDVIGLQEPFRDQIDDIRKMLPEYDKIGVGRDGKKKGEYSAIFYRVKRFKVEKSDTFWLSSTPGKPSKSREWGNDCIRICTWAHFIERESGQSFYMYNTHLDHKSQLSREKSIRLIMTHIQKRKHLDPFVLTGDFNVGEGNSIIKYLKGENIADHSPITLVDTFRVLYPDEKVVGTYNDFVGKSKGSKIDYIFVDASTHTLSASIIRTQKGGRYPSDHYPIIAALYFGL